MSTEVVELTVTVLLQENDLHWRRPPLGAPRLEGKKVLARFDRGYCILTERGQDPSKGLWARPSSFSRPDTHTIIIDTGSFNFGRIILSFDSAAETDTAENILTASSRDD